MKFAFRALEMHGMRMWQRDKFIEALDFAVEHRLTAVVLHQTDIIQQLVFPRRYFDPLSPWKDTPVRRGENAIHNNRRYLEHLLRLAGKRGIDVWLEVKELGFPDELLERFPQLVKDGTVCPSEPIWQEFVAEKYRELSLDFPSLAGVIMSPGSPEGRVSLAQAKCKCDLCKGADLSEWYGGIIRAAHASLHASEMRLAVRDFAYRPRDHEPLMAAVDASPVEIVFVAKVTPHDFYPTFPDNPALGSLKSREQWIEYDAHGQFYGWGVFGAYMIGDMSARLERAEAAGASGVIFRTEWERVNDWWCLETPNRANLELGARLARGGGPDSAKDYVQWVRDKGWRCDEEMASKLQELFSRSWSILRDAIYLGPLVLHDSSMFPLSISKAWWTMEVKHSLAAWDERQPARLEVDDDVYQTHMRIKSHAVAKAENLLLEIQEGLTEADPELREWLERRFEQLCVYTATFRTITSACLLVRWAEQPSPANIPTKRREELRQVLVDLRRRADQLESDALAANDGHQLAMLLDHKRLRQIAADVAMCTT